MIVRYEVGYIDQQGWYNNVDAFHYMGDAVDAANGLESATILRSHIRVTEQRFANHDAYICSDGLHRSKAMTLDEAAKSIGKATILEIDTTTPDFREALSEIEHKRRNDISLTKGERVLCDACNI